MVSPPHRSLPDELDDVIEALGRSADERALPVLLKRLIRTEREYIWNELDVQLAEKAILMISERVGHKSFPYLLDASNGPVQHVLVAIEALCRLRHPHALAILKKRWKEFEARSGYGSIPLLELLKHFDDLESFEFCLSLVTSNDRDELHTLVGVLIHFVEVCGSRLPVDTLKTMCTLPNCVGPLWEVEEKNPVPPSSLQESIRLGRVNWKVDFESVRKIASDELLRRGVEPPDAPVTFRRAMSNA